MSTDNPFITERIAAAMQNLGGLPPALPNAIIDAGVHIAGQLVQEHKVIAVGIDSFALQPDHGHKFGQPAVTLSPLVP